MDTVYIPTLSGVRFVHMRIGPRFFVSPWLTAGLCGIALGAVVFVVACKSIAPIFHSAATTNWVTYQNDACGISYAIPPGWVSQGSSGNAEIVTLSSPDDIRQDEINPRMTDAGPASPSTSFFLSCADDVADIFDGQDRTLVENGASVEAALAKGLLKNLKTARFRETIEVAGQKAFVYDIGAADSRPGMRYDSVFVYVNDRWMEIRPSMTRFSDRTSDQQGILDSIRFETRETRRI